MNTQLCHSTTSFSHSACDMTTAAGELRRLVRQSPTAARCARTHLDSATNREIAWRSAGLQRLRPGVFGSGSCKGAVPESDDPVAVSRFAGCARGGRLRWACALLVAVLGLARLLNVAHGASSSAEQNWPQWRGPLQSGVAPHADPPTEWSETRNVKWKVKIPG
jgi:hypothetical protein